MEYIKISRQWIQGHKKSTALDKSKGLPITWHSTQGQWGSRGIALLIHNLGARRG